MHTDAPRSTPRHCTGPLRYRHSFRFTPLLAYSWGADATVGRNFREGLFAGLLLRRCIRELNFDLRFLLLCFFSQVCLLCFFVLNAPIHAASARMVVGDTTMYRISTRRTRSTFDKTDEFLCCHCFSVLFSKSFTT